MSNVRPLVSVQFSGSGPGYQAPDGCSVELYRRLPYLGELDELRSLLSAGESVLELGCGTGRLTQILLEWGSRVTAVDNSPHMLALVPHTATRVQSEIATLNLEESFNTVLLASCLINHPSPSVRSAFIAAGRRHLRSGGHLFVQRHDPNWLSTALPGPVGTTESVAQFVEAVRHTGTMVEMTLRYECDGQTDRKSVV